MTKENTENELELRVKGIMAMLTRFNSTFARAQRETDEILLVWADYLAKRNFTVKQIRFALNEISIKGPTFMPSSHEIAGVLVPASTPKEFRAEKIATEIHEAILDTLSGQKTNFLDELALDTLATIEILGGFRVLKESDLFKDINRARVVRSAMAVLVAEEAKIRNAKLTAQGISCTAISGFDVQKIESVNDVISSQHVQRELSTTNGLKPLGMSIEELSSEVKSIRESIA